MKNLIIAAVAFWLFSESQNATVAAIGAIKRKSAWKPPYKNRAVPGLWSSETNFRFAQGKTGVYLVKKNGVIIYIGAGRNVYKTMLRHFESHKGECKERCNKQDYYSDYDNNDYLVRVVLTNTPKQAFALEAALINKYRPRDNAYVPEIFDKSVIQDFTHQPVETFDEAPF